jgi:hypothetical protein
MYRTMHDTTDRTSSLSRANLGGRGTSQLIGVDAEVNEPLGVTSGQ